MATVFPSKQSNRKPEIKITNSRQKHKETNKKSTQNDLLTEVEEQQIQREHQAE